MQTESNALVGTRYWSAVARCIEQIVCHGGWVYYDRPVGLQSETGVEIPPVECIRMGCGRKNPAGLVYCFTCMAVLPGARERCIFSTFTKLDNCNYSDRANAEAE